MIACERQCVWCDKEFTPDDQLPLAIYNLINAGRTICLDCADKWEDAQVDLHQSKVRCFLDEAKGAVMTATGHILPMRLVGWTEKTNWRTGKLRLFAEAVDDNGQHWYCRREDGLLCTLIPKGDTWFGSRLSAS